SIIAYYIGYFSILPSVIEHITRTFYGSIANVLLNCGIAAAAIVVSWKASTSEWSRSYRMIAIGLSLYTAASLSFVMFNFAYTEFFWCGAFWSMAVAIEFAPPAGAKTMATVIVPYRYGLSMMLIGAISVFHLVMTLLLHPS